MDSFTIGNSLSKLSMLETWHPRTDEDLASISSERLTPGERLLECYTEGGYEAGGSNYKAGVAEILIKEGLDMLKNLK